jgi:uncharacterized protein YjbJ (UPF0337 family)
VPSISTVYQQMVLCAVAYRSPGCFPVKFCLSDGKHPALLMCHTINYPENFMNKQQVQGLAEETQGKIKEAAGVLLDDDEMTLKGNIEKNVGKVRAGFGDLKQEIKDNQK